MNTGGIKTEYLSRSNWARPHLG